MQSSKGYKVEIWFRIEKDQDGYPASKESEALLATPHENDFRIESIPIYLKNVSRGDIVRAKLAQGGEIFEFDGVAKRGGHNTYRLLLKDKAERTLEATIGELRAKGLYVEQERGGLLAVDAPPDIDQGAADRYLTEQSDEGRWEMQDGFLFNVPTH